MEWRNGESFQTFSTFYLRSGRKHLYLYLFSCIFSSVRHTFHVIRKMMVMVMVMMVMMMMMMMMCWIRSRIAPLVPKRAFQTLFWFFKFRRTTAALGAKLQKSKQRFGTLLEMLPLQTNDPSKRHFDFFKFRRPAAAKQAKLQQSTNAFQMQESKKNIKDSRW